MIRWRSGPIVVVLNALAGVGLGVGLWDHDPWPIVCAGAPFVLSQVLITYYAGLPHYR